MPFLPQPYFNDPQRRNQKDTTLRTSQLQPCSTSRSASHCDPTWLNLVGTSAGVLMRALGIGSAAVLAWLSVLINKIR